MKEVSTVAAEEQKGTCVHPPGLPIRMEQWLTFPQSPEQHSDMIEIDSGFTSITALPDRLSTTAPRAGEQRARTGARVVLAFSRATPLPEGAAVLLRYDIAENGHKRELITVPQLTHTTKREPDGLVYHYRVSHWIPPEQLFDDSTAREWNPQRQLAAIA